MSLNLLIMIPSLLGGGAERVACSWANGLVNLGHNVSIMTDSQDESYPINEKIQIINHKSIFKNKISLFARIIRKLINPILTICQLFQYIKKEKPSAIIVIMYYNEFSLLLARLISGQHFPIIMTDHNVFERPKGCEFGFRQWRNKFIDSRFFEVITVLTKKDKEILNRKGIKSVEVLYNPLSLKPALEVPLKENIILAVGRTEAWKVKGFDLLVKAWDKIASAYPKWKLRIVGKATPETINFLQSLCKNSLESIEFMPFTNDIEYEYKRASIFVLSSRHEGWGLVMIEAMSQGCAVIACDYKGRQAEAITDGVNGLLCETDNADAIAEKISLLIEDSNLRSILQETATKSVEFYRENKVAKRLENIILNQLR